MYVSFIDRALSALEEILNSPDITSPALAGTTSDEQGAYSGGGLSILGSSSARAAATKRQRGGTADERSFSSASTVSDGVADDFASLSSVMTGKAFHLSLPGDREGNYLLKKAIILQAVFGGSEKNGSCSSVGTFSSSYDHAPASSGMDHEARITGTDGQLINRENDHHSGISTKDSKKKSRVATASERVTPAAVNETNKGASSNPTSTGLIEARLRIFKDYLHIRHSISSEGTTFVLAPAGAGADSTSSSSAAGDGGSMVRDTEKYSIEIACEQVPPGAGAVCTPAGGVKRTQEQEGVAEELSNDLLAVTTPDFLDLSERLLQVCTGDVRHVTPLPSYRDSGGKNCLSTNYISQRYAEYECYGLLAIMEDSFKIRAFCESVSTPKDYSCASPVLLFIISASITAATHCLF